MHVVSALTESVATEAGSGAGIGNFGRFDFDGVFGILAQRRADVAQW